MHGIARKDVDTAGGIQLNGGQDWCEVDGHRVILLGDPVQGHDGASHDAPVMAEGSSWVSIGGIPVCREGHLASCGHPSTGSEWVKLSD